MGFQIVGIISIFYLAMSFTDFVKTHLCRLKGFRRHFCLSPITRYK
ncbi:hypothetical protein NEILACOT_04282 [Neisseria lactamica ATCC 23970]|uniref:Uncharacterized protein n=1 Tax=Neisseria lactamica ATCC 23970 TaxID=546265 RepID=D0W9R9_NEILA|nr:hypothetical protein NEILACOT_04282 [Neisseria lactamica ATCC 23970]